MTASTLATAGFLFGEMSLVAGGAARSALEVKAASSAVRLKQPQVTGGSMSNEG